MTDETNGGQQAPPADNDRALVRALMILGPNGVAEAFERRRGWFKDVNSVPLTPDGRAAFFQRKAELDLLVRAIMDEAAIRLTQFNAATDVISTRQRLQEGDPVVTPTAGSSAERVNELTPTAEVVEEPAAAAAGVNVDQEAAENLQPAAPLDPPATNEAPVEAQATPAPEPPTEAPTGSGRKGKNR